MIYLNHGATSYPKPQCVTDRVAEQLAALPSGQFRSTAGIDDGDLFTAAREGIAKILGVRSERIFFTSGSTEALNFLISGFHLPASAFLTTAAEHNSVLRPLFQLIEHEELPSIVPVDQNGRISPEAIEQAILPRHKVLIVNHCSNVTGAIADLKTIGQIAKAHGLWFLVDVSQSAGCIPMSLDEVGVHGAAFTGHKALLGIQGSGGMYLSEDLPISPVKFGGTGRDSSKIRYTDGDAEWEVGTQNSPGIAALATAAAYVLRQDVAKIHQYESRLVTETKQRLSALPNVHVIGMTGDDYGPVVSFTIDGMNCADVSYILQNSYDIVTRSGLQCAPLIHTYLGTAPKGCVRASFGFSNTMEDVDALAYAVREITEAL